MEQRISLITLGVSDLDQSRGFYERLGWRRSAPDAEGVVFFQVGGLVLSLFPREFLCGRMAKYIGPAPVSRARSWGIDRMVD